MVKVTHKPTLQQIAKGYVKYVFKNKDYFADIKNCVWRGFNDTGKCLKHKVKRARCTSIFTVYDLFKNKYIWLGKYTKCRVVA